MANKTIVYSDVITKGAEQSGLYLIEYNSSLNESSKFRTIIHLTCDILGQITNIQLERPPQNYKAHYDTHSDNFDQAETDILKLLLRIEPNGDILRNYSEFIDRVVEYHKPK